MVGIHHSRWRRAGGAFLLSIVGAAVGGCGDRTTIGERCRLDVEHAVAANDVVTVAHAADCPSGTCLGVPMVTGKELPDGFMPLATDEGAVGATSTPAACDAGNPANLCCNLAGRRGVYANCPAGET